MALTRKLSDDDKSNNYLTRSQLETIIFEVLKWKIVEPAKCIVRALCVIIKGNLYRCLFISHISIKNLTVYKAILEQKHSIFFIAAVSRAGVTMGIQSEF